MTPETIHLETTFHPRSKENLMKNPDFLQKNKHAMTENVKKNIYFQHKESTTEK